MRITYACPACGATVAVEDAERTRPLVCPRCAATIDVPADAVGWSGPGGEPAAAGTGLPRLTANGAGVGGCGGGGGFGVTPVYQLTDLQFSVVAMISPTMPYASPQMLARYSPYGETKFLALPAHL